MDRSDFQRLAQVRLEEAKALRDEGKFEGAYYLAGYSVECALKACIAKRTKAEEFPPKPKTVGKYYTHNLHELLWVAELEKECNKIPVSDAFRINWATVERWNEESRYEEHSEADAVDLINAIENQSHGVFPWLQKLW